MTYEINVKRKDDDKSPLEVSVNVATGKLKINNREITFGDFTLIQGPFGNEQKPWILVRYDIGKREEREADIIKLESIPALKVDKVQEDDGSRVLFTQINFPPRTHISCYNYDF